LACAACICYQIPQKNNFFLQLSHCDVDNTPSLALVIALLLLGEDESSLAFGQLLKKPLQGCDKTLANEQKKRQ
jgi:hypothetical protein